MRAIIRDGNRAADVVSRMRALFKKARPTKEPLNINEAIEEVVSPNPRRSAEKQSGVTDGTGRESAFGNGRPSTNTAGRMNLILNGIQAMSAVEDRERFWSSEPNAATAIRSGWLFKTAESALIQGASNESLMLSTPPNPAAWVWGYRSVVRLLKVTADGFGLLRTTVLAQPFNSLL